MSNPAITEAAPCEPMHPDTSPEWHPGKGGQTE
jgi:hypothetical protein